MIAITYNTADGAESTDIMRSVRTFRRHSVNADRIVRIEGVTPELAEAARRGIDIYNPHGLYGRRRPAIAL